MRSTLYSFPCAPLSALPSHQDAKCQNLAASRMIPWMGSAGGMQVHSCKLCAGESNMQLQIYSRTAVARRRWRRYAEKSEDSSIGTSRSLHRFLETSLDLQQWSRWRRRPRRHCRGPSTCSGLQEPGSKRYTAACSNWSSVQRYVFETPAMLSPWSSTAHTRPLFPVGPADPRPGLQPQGWAPGLQVWRRCAAPAPAAACGQPQAVAPPPLPPKRPVAGQAA